MTEKIRSMAATHKQVWVFVPDELTDEQRKDMLAVICEHGETLSGELYGEWNNGPEYIKYLMETYWAATNVELYGKFLQCFHELSEGPSMPRPAPDLQLVPTRTR